MRKCIEIRVKVHDVDEDDKFEVDTNCAPGACYIYYDDEEAEIVYAEAEELMNCIDRLAAG